MIFLTHRGCYMHIYYNFTIQLHFGYYSLENDVRISLNLRISLVSSASWLVCPKVLVLMNKGEHQTGRIWELGDLLCSCLGVRLCPVFILHNTMRSKRFQKIRLTNRFVFILSIAHVDQPVHLNCCCR